MVTDQQCIEWGGALTSRGYGSKWADGRMVGAHRWAYEQKYGPIPEGMVVRHRCDNRACVNVAHLELGTQSQNVRDAVERGRWTQGGEANRRKTHCPRDHEYNEANTRVRSGRRFCRSCDRERVRS